MTLVDKGDLAMFQLRPIYTNGPRGPIPDLRYVALNLEDKTAARIAKYAKAAAMGEHKGDKDGVEKRRAAAFEANTQPRHRSRQHPLSDVYDPAPGYSGARNRLWGCLGHGVQAR